MRCPIKLCLAAVVSFLVGCNQPAVTPKAPAFQSSENTIRDWNDVAHRIATQLTALGLLSLRANWKLTSCEPARPSHAPRQVRLS